MPPPPYAPRTDARAHSPGDTAGRPWPRAVVATRVGAAYTRVRLSGLSCRAAAWGGRDQPQAEMRGHAVLV